MKAKDYRGSSILDPGVHKLEIVGISMDDQTKAGDPLLKLRWQEANGDGMLWDNLAVSMKAAWKMEQLWSALGGDPEEEVGDVTQFSERLVALINRVGYVYALVYTDTYQGTERSKIKEYKSEEVGKRLQQAQGGVKKDLEGGEYSPF